MFIKAFTPLSFTSTQTISATTTSSPITFTGDDITRATHLRVYNRGTVSVPIRWGKGAQVALVTDMRIGPGCIEVFYKGSGADTAAAITDSGTALVDFTPGIGV